MQGGQRRWQPRVGQCHPSKVAAESRQGRWLCELAVVALMGDRLYLKGIDPVSEDNRSPWLTIRERSYEFGKGESETPEGWLFMSGISVDTQFSAYITSDGNYRCECVCEAPSTERAWG